MKEMTFFRVIPSLGLIAALQGCVESESYELSTLFESESLLFYTSSDIPSQMAEIKLITSQGELMSRSVDAGELNVGISCDVDCEVPINECVVCYSFLPTSSSRGESLNSQTVSDYGVLLQDYRVATNLQDQQMLMWASSNNIERAVRGKGVELKYRKALSKLDLVIEAPKDGFTLEIAENGVVIHNVVTSGTLSLNRGAAKWTELADSDDFVAINEPVKIASEEDGSLLLTEKSPFILMPQNIGANSWDAANCTIEQAEQEQSAYMSIKAKLYRTNNENQKNYCIGAECGGGEGIDKDGFQNIYVPFDSIVEDYNAGVWSMGESTTYIIDIVEDAKLESGVSAIGTPIGFTTKVKDWDNAGV